MSKFLSMMPMEYWCEAQKQRILDLGFVGGLARQNMDDTLIVASSRATDREGLEPEMSAQRSEMG